MSCTKCRINRANPGYAWCQSCFVGGATQPLCKLCHRTPANPGHSWCQSCYVSSQNSNTTQGNGIYFYDKNKPYYQFTNFWVAPFTIRNMTYQSVEHFYQASKFDGNNYIRQQICNSLTPSDARRLAKANQQFIRNSFWAEQDDIMYQAIYSKFALYVDLRNLLISTGNCTLFEDSPTDDYWGIGQNRTGQNKLGEILMRVRDSARTWPQFAFILY